MERYNQLFERLNSLNQGAFVPFVTLGDPDAETSLKIIDALIEGGADALEIGIPFSDPLADGPTIQNANLRAFKSEITPTICFELLSRIRAKHPTMPIGLLVYANLVFTNGIENFYIRCQKAGVDSVLVADVPMSESKPFREAALAHNIAPIFICPPNGDDALLQQIGEHSRGYTYLLSRAGVTGTEKRAQMPLTHLISLSNIKPLLHSKGLVFLNQNKSSRQLKMVPLVPFQALLWLKLLKITSIIQMSC